MHEIPAPDTRGNPDFADRMDDDTARLGFMMAGQKAVLSAQMRQLRGGVPPGAAFDGLADRMSMRLARRVLRQRLHQLEAMGTCELTVQQLQKVALFFGVGLRVEFVPFTDVILDRRALRDGGKLAGLARPTAAELRAWLAANPASKP